jgi:hypothetical protein
MITVYVRNVQSEDQYVNHHLKQNVVIYPKAAWLTSYSSLPECTSVVVALKDMSEGVQETNNQKLTSCENKLGLVIKLPAVSTVGETSLPHKGQTLGSG